MLDLLRRVVIAELNRGIGISIIVGSTLYGITFAFAFAFMTLRAVRKEERNRRINEVIYWFQFSGFLLMEYYLRSVGDV